MFRSLAVAKRDSRLDWDRLGAREREILEALFARPDTSVAEVRDSLENPPTYSAVRGMLALLEQKGYVRHRRDGLRYLYSPTISRSSAQSTALKKLLETFFGGSPTKAVAALLDLPQDERDEMSIKELRKAVLAAQARGK
jgi:CRISPR-associated Cas5-like protein